MTNIQVTYAAQDNKGITLTEKNNKPVTSSREVALNFDKRHDNVIRDIEKFYNHAPNYFTPVDIEDSYGRLQPSFTMTREGFLLLTSSFRGENALKLKIEMLEKFDMVPPSLPERAELKFLDKLQESLKNFDLVVERQYKVLGYRIDGYIKELNLAIEYDEHQHKNQVDDDLTRQKQITDDLGCTFIRVSIDDSDAFNIGKILKHIMEVM